MQNRLDLIDLLLIAEAVLGVPAEQLHHALSLGVAEAALAAPFLTVGATDLYRDPAEQAAICCSRLVRSRPFPTGNTLVAYECMLEMLARSGIEWPHLDAGSVATIVEKLARHEVSEEEFVRWVKARTEG
jgi:prophage maintenance system killer protein